MTDDSIDEYLWDRSGEADPQLQRLEDLLARFRHARPVFLVSEQRVVDDSEPDQDV